MAGKFDRALGSRTIKKAAEENRAKANAPKVEYIDIDLLDENPDNEKIFNMDKIDILENSMKKDGFGGAIEVFKKRDGRYEISSGHRRFRAAKNIGMKQIPCFVNAMQDDVAKARKLVMSNIANRDMTPLDTARSMEYYVRNVLIPTGYEKQGDINGELMKVFGGSLASVKRYRGLLKLIPELQELANDERYPYSAFESAVRLSEDDQKKLYTMIKNYSKSHPDENGEGGFVSRKFIVNHVRDLLKEEGIYRESRNREIAKKHKEKQTKDKNSNNDDSTVARTKSEGKTDGKGSSAADKEEFGSNAKTGTGVSDNKGSAEDTEVSGNAVKEDNTGTDADRTAELQNKAADDSDNDLLLSIERIKKSIRSIADNGVSDKNVVVSQLRSLKNEIDRVIKSL